MQTSKRKISSLLLVVATFGWHSTCPLAGESSDAKTGAASHVEPIHGSKLSRVTLTEKAAKRLDIKTVQVAAGSSGGLVAPYAAVLYDVNGGAWVYTNPEPLTYVRQRVVVDSVKDQNAFLKEGPSPGTPVVVVGAAELYGAEVGVGH